MKVENKYKLEKIVSKDTTRHAITCAYLDTKDKTPRLIATNGHAMAVIKVEAEKDEQGNVPIAAIIDARKLNSKKAIASTLSLNGDCKLDNGATYKRQDSQFPDWRKIGTTGDKTFRVAFDAKLLHELADSLGSFKGVVSLEFFGDLKGPIKVHAWDASGADHENFGLLMPCTER